MTDKLNYFKSELTEDNYLILKDFFEKFKQEKSIEFEINFKNITIVDHTRIIKHFVNIYDEKNINFTKSLDINISLDNNTTIRASFNGEHVIDEYAYKFSGVQNIIDYLKSIKSPDVTFMYKSRNDKSIMFLDAFDVSIKSIKEETIKQFPTSIKQANVKAILYRYKERITFKNSDHVIDITEVNQTKNFADIYSNLKNYEIELELTNKNIKIDRMFESFYEMLVVIQDSILPISKNESSYVIDCYSKINKPALIGNRKAATHLTVRNVVSIDKNAVVYNIPNKYAVVDKSDGDRCFMIILERGVYLISTNMKVKKTDLKQVPEKYFNTILDGELITLKSGKKLFLVFDVVYCDKIDYKYAPKDSNYNIKNGLLSRIAVYKDVIDNCFKTQINIVDYRDKNTDMDLSKIKKYYQNELKNYWQKINNLIKTKPCPITVIGKNYFVSYGFDKSEIYMYANLIYQTYTYEKLTPYKLDGMIYTPLNTPYLIDNNKDTYLEYKWKRYTENSIDFYITIEKDENGDDIVFSSSLTPDKNTKYKICNLHVGRASDSAEQPVPFKVANINQKAYVKINDDAIRDIENNIIYDNTVVEFFFDIHLTGVDSFYKWVPMRTRFDKTESVLKYKKRYGNNVNVANNIWKTITNPVTEQHISLLSSPETYQTEISRLQSELSQKNNKPGFTINKSKSETYYQKKTDNVSGMRSFNNWIKNTMIETYCNARSSVLDIGCGRGGDIIKFINAGISEYVGIDIDYNGLFGITDCAINRYRQFKATLKNVPEMNFIYADARGLFDSKSQINILKRMSSTNINLIDTLLSGKKKYDIINCQFSMHYYLSDQSSWNNFMQNLNDHLSDNGYFVMTCFDGDLIRKKLLNKSSLSSSYTNDKGEKVIMFDIKKLYNDNAPLNIGDAIDLYNSVISNDNVYNTEYLVYHDFLNQQFKKNCSMDLVESDTFESIYKCYIDYFNDTNSYINNNSITFKKFNEIHNFYKMLNVINKDLYSTNDIELTKASYDFSMLYRYYVYKKDISTNVNKASRLIGLNGNIKIGNILTPHFERSGIQINPSQKTKKINDLYNNIKKQVSGIPSIYLIRHKNIDISLNKKSITKSHYDFVKLKQGDNNAVIIYKCPEKFFYPIARKTANGLNYLITSKKCINDLNMMVELTNKFC